jgi:hypothetical protein
LVLAATFKCNVGVRQHKGINSRDESISRFR